MKIIYRTYCTSFDRFSAVFTLKRKKVDLKKKNLANWGTAENVELGAVKLNTYIRCSQVGLGAAKDRCSQLRSGAAK